VTSSDELSLAAAKVFAQFVRRPFPFPVRCVQMANDSKVPLEDKHSRR